MQKLIVAALTAVLSGASAGHADTRHDGLWVVEVAAQTPDPRCQERSVALRVQDGQVRYEGLLSGIAKGSVEPSGNIDVTIARIRVDGKLSENTGHGAWRSKNCAGTWQARRA
jgi:hypothetical protein